MSKKLTTGTIQGRALLKDLRYFEKIFSIIFPTVSYSLAEKWWKNNLIFITLARWILRVNKIFSHEHLWKSLFPEKVCRNVKKKIPCYYTYLYRRGGYSSDNHPNITEKECQEIGCCYDHSKEGKRHDILCYRPFPGKGSVFVLKENIEK